MAVAVFQRHDLPMVLPANFHELDADALRQLLIAQDRELTWRQTKIDQLTHELSLHKRWRFGVKTERLSDSTTRRVPSASNATSAASGRVPTAKPWCRPRCPPT